MTEVIKLITSKRNLVILLIVLLLVLLAAGLYFKPGQKPSKQAAPVDSSKLVKTEAQKAEVVVEITQDGLVPQTIKMKKGEAVRFLNNDTKPHQIMSDPHPTHTLYPFLNTDEVLEKGESVTVIVETKGNLTYHDHLNPLKFRGTVIVE